MKRTGTLSRPSQVSGGPDWTDCIALPVAVAACEAGSVPTAQRAESRTREGRISRISSGLRLSGRWILAGVAPAHWTITMLEVLCNGIVPRDSSTGATDLNVYCTCTLTVLPGFLLGVHVVVTVTFIPIALLWT